MSGGGFHERVGTKRDLARQLQNYADKPMPDGGMPATAPSIVGNIAQAVMDLGVSRWADRGDAFYGVGETRAELPPGLYRCVEIPHIGPALMKQKVETDNLLELPDDAGAEIIAEFRHFWKVGEKFRERGFLHKRGFLLWGPPGSGKTSCVQLLTKRLIEERQGVVLFLDHAHLAAACLQMARKIEPKRPMIAIMEDMEALVRR